MIYCVVPPELGEDTFQRLVDHYKDNPNVKVILERRRSGHGPRSQDPVAVQRDRRQRTPGSLRV
ncbi:MAG: hypothetical protein R2826_03985 [Thermoleophilia bacterium]